MNNALTIRNLYGGYKGNELFQNFNLDVPKGQFTALVGPNGSGKSTLFRMILKGLKKKSGQILVQGNEIDNIRQIDLAKLVAFIPQYYIFPEGFSVRQVISMSDFAGRTCNDDEIDSALKTAGIEGLGDRMANEISGGEAQLVMLCRAICCKTKLILMDEPTSNLDINRQSQLLKAAKKLTEEEGKTVFCAIHDLNSALNHANWCHVLDAGKLYASGTPNEVFNENMLQDVFHSDAQIFTEPISGRRIIIA
jgi:ABC-type cobalamin/Fe3+-siderophores transport system ATPase subunit